MTFDPLNSAHMKKHALIASALLALVSPTWATTVGYDTAPLGNRASAEIGYSLWDSFTNGITFAGAVPTAGDISLTLTQSATGVGGGFGPLAPDQDYFYTSTKATNWTISGSAASIDIYSVVLQIKLSSPFDGSPIAGFFSPTLDGVGTTAPVVVASGIAGASGTYSVLKWTWTGLNIPGGTNLNINFSSANGKHVAIDGFAVDVAPVPEPSTYAIGIGALLIGVIIMRRRRAATAG